MFLCRGVTQRYISGTYFISLLLLLRRKRMVDISHTFLGTKKVSSATSGEDGYLARFRSSTISMLPIFIKIVRASNAPARFYFSFIMANCHFCGFLSLGNNICHSFKQVIRFYRENHSDMKEYTFILRVYSKLRPNFSIRISVQSQVGSSSF